MKKLFIIISILAIAGNACKDKKSNSGTFADKIYIKGIILTLDSLNTIQEAVAVKDGKILDVGTSRQIIKYKGKATSVFDLKGKTLIPGFIDGHSHILSLDRTQMVNISSPPVGSVTKIADIISEIQNYIETRKVKQGEWIIAIGYDQDQLEEKRHPVKEDMDKAFPDNPVILRHASGHLTVGNSLALKAANIDSTTPDPVNGVIVRKKGSREPTGLMQGRANHILTRVRSRETPKLSYDEKIKLLKDQQTLYASVGITTAQDGSTNAESVEFIRKAAEQNELHIDVMLLAAYSIIDRLINDPEYKPGVTKNHVKIQGVKYFSDGSPQGKTAFFSEPYLTEVPGCDSDCRGIPLVNQEQFNEAVKKAFAANIQFYAHANGDSAIGMFIHAVENANKELNTSGIGRRPVTIHSQFVRDDQLYKYAELGFVPSFFSNHAFFWGDTHVENLGKDRAYFLSPLKTSMERGIIYTNHTDYGVTPIDQLFLLWTSVVRKSRSGEIIGPGERLTPMEGLRALTINGAYQYFEEDIKGSIEAGKLADMVILSDNPVTINPDEIKNIAVLETIKEGETVYKNSLDDE